MRSEFTIRYHPLLRPLFGVLGMRWGRCRVDVAADAIAVTMGWAFRAWIPLSSVVDAAPARSPLLLGVGVHGWAGRWAVNGSRRDVVRIDVDPPARGRVCGFPVHVRTLWTSLDDPDGLLAEVRTAAPPQRSR